MRTPIAEALACKAVLQTHVDPRIRYVERFDVLGQPDDTNESTMFFATKSDGSDGWYSQPFDRGVIIRSLCSAKAQCIFVVEGKVPEVLRCRNHVLVKSIESYLAQLVSLRYLSGRLVKYAITGSVGKTTFVRMLTSSLRHHGGAIYVEARRVTPLILYDHLLNRVGKGTKNLVVETGLFEKHHVRDLVSILRPSFGVLLNACDMHTGKPGLLSVADVVSAKASVVTGSEQSVINQLLVSYLDRRNLDGMATFEVISSHSGATKVESMTEGLLHIRSGSGNKYRISRYLHTNTFAEQVLALICCLEQRELNATIIEETVNAVISDPAVYSLKISERNGQLLLIDRHASYRAYFEATAMSDYRDIALVIGSFNFVDEEPSRNIGSILRTCARYDAVFIARELKAVFRWEALPPRPIIRWEPLRDLLNAASQFRTVVVHDPLNAIDCSF